MAIGGVPRELAGRVGQHDDRKLEPFRLVDGHQPHAVAAVLENRRLRRLGPRGRLAQLVDEAAKRQPAVGLVAPGQLGDVQHVGQRLLAPGRRTKPTCARVAVSRSFKVSATGRVVAPLMQIAQQAQRLAHRLQVRRHVPGTLERMEPSEVMAILEQSSSPIANSAPRSVANTDSSSSGHSTAASAARIVSTSSRSWNDLPPTSRCAMPRASRACT